jgi:nitroimidazol reductase NimA-like FMN-containing flavoprotein (pyridoxamine 5'-phosphate oxidase superfamily)
MADAAGLEVLAEEECFRLLGKVPIGRIVFSDRALPAIQPVNFVLDGRAVVVRTAAGSRLALAASDSVVAFEADEFRDGRDRSGWSVVAVGHAKTVTGVRELAHARRLDLQPWAPGAKEHYLRIAVEVITGRRLCA